MWQSAKLGELLEIARGGSPRPIKSFITDDDDGVNWIKIGDTEQGEKFIYSTKQKIKRSGISRSRYVSAGDFLLSNSMSFGRPYILQIDGCIHDGWLVLSNYGSHFIADYLYYLLSSSVVKNQFEMAARGSTVRNLNIDLVANVEVSYPPLAEQQSIVAKLDAAFAEIDELKTCALAQSSQVQLLTERVLSEQTTADDELVQLSDVCGIEVGLIDPKIFPYKEQTHIGAGNIVSSSNELIELKTAEQEKLSSGKYPFDETTVLYSKIRPYLKKVHLPNFTGICSADMYPLKPISEKLDREYLFYILLSEDFTNYAIAGSARAGMPKVNRNHLFAYQFRLPSLEKQRNIIKVLSTAFTSKIELEKIIQRKIDTIESLKSAILAQELQTEAA